MHHVMHYTPKLACVNHVWKYLHQVQAAAGMLSGGMQTCCSSLPVHKGRLVVWLTQIPPFQDAVIRPRV